MEDCCPPKLSSAPNNPGAKATTSAAIHLTFEAVDKKHGKAKEAFVVRTYGHVDCIPTANHKRQTIRPTNLTTFGLDMRLLFMSDGPCLFRAQVVGLPRGPSDKR